MAATVKATKTAAKRPAAKPAAAKRAAPRTRKALPPVAPAPEADFEMIRLVSSPEAERPRVPLFSIDDTVYSIEAKPGMNIALEALHLFRTGGDRLPAEPAPRGCGLPGAAGVRRAHPGPVHADR
jgi:hypothetical protein